MEHSSSELLNSNTARRTSASSALGIDVQQSVSSSTVQPSTPNVDPNFGIPPIASAPPAGYRRVVHHQSFLKSPPLKKVEILTPSTTPTNPAVALRKKPPKRPSTAPAAPHSIARQSLLPASAAIMSTSRKPRNPDTDSTIPSRALDPRSPSSRIPPPSGSHSKGGTPTQGRIASTSDLTQEFNRVVVDGILAPEPPEADASIMSVLKSSAHLDWSTASLASGVLPSNVIVGSNWTSNAKASSEVLNWPEFIRAYAAGRWDPHSIPMQPRASSTFSPRNYDPVTPALTLASYFDESQPLKRSTTTSGVSSGTSVPVEEVSLINSPETKDSTESSLSQPASPKSGVITEPPTLMDDASSGGSLDQTDSTKLLRQRNSPSIPLAIRRGTDPPDLRAPVLINVTQPTPPSKTPVYPANNSCLDVLRPALPSSSSDPLTSTVNSEDSKPATSVAAASEVITAAATMRWAGAGINVAPLALPSPESELTDPMRKFSGKSNATGAAQVSHSMPKAASGKTVDRSGRRYSDNRSTSAAASCIPWNGLPSSAPGMVILPRTPSPRLESIMGSPATSPGDNDYAIETDDTPPVDLATGGSTQNHEKFYRVVSASSSFYSSMSSSTTHPLISAPGPESSKRLSADDYFGDVTRLSRSRSQIIPSTPPDAPLSRHRSQGESEERENQQSRLDSSSSTAVGSPSRSNAVSTRTRVDPGGRRNVGSNGTAGTPPLSHSTFVVINSPPSYVGSVGNETAEVTFAQLGYLIPPIPPDERERRRALYKFNVLYTNKDVNFERIAHLAKLVFNTKMVVISLIDNNNQWHKAESGLGLAQADRAVSFCGHTILQRGDEPLVVLDAEKDWRFRKNPLVVGGPHIRFYAGAPLRTSEGYNIGSLCVIDDQPRTDCTPRQRHTLKEFAAIVMREMELWRDKIQLRIRDKIQTSMEKFTRECLEMGIPEAEKRSLKDNMGKVYHQAAVLVKETLGVDGAVVFDISQFDAIESVGPDGKSTLIYHADFYEPQGSAVNSPGVGTVPRASKQEFGSISDLPILGAAEDLVAPNRGRMLSGEDHAKISKFLATCPDGKIYERLPSCFKHLVPPDIQYTMLVPVFNVDRQPFALLCAYTTKGSMHFLEGYELQYLRAIGVIILSAVLKRRMMLADKSKALFISNISHELRTPLHGILASAELLSDTRLTVNQSSYLQTVQACATSLVETVNHVLDFTKLSGSTKPENDAPTIKPQKINLQQLVDETVEGCWLGARARESHTTDDYGSMYSPPKSQDLSPTSEYPSFGQVSNMPNVETVTDIALRHKGWIVKSDRGGIRRILMNLIGNSLKFTHKGFIQVGLKELPPSEAHPNKCMIELSVSDSGKGISKEFLQNRMFQPFSQENPLQSGTGLGLAIVNNIVKSLNGKVDMWSAPEWGTQARITLPVDLVDVGDGVPKLVLPGQSISVSMMGFDQSHPGTSRLYDSIADYLVAWWGFTIVKEEPADILVVNEGIEIIKALTQSREFLRPVVLLSYSRGDPALLSAVNAFERLGGWCRIVFKPTGPTRLQQALSNALAQLGKLRHTPSSPEWTGRSRHNTQESTLGIIDGNDIEFPKSHETNGVFPNILTRRHSDELRDKKPIRPGMGSRSTTYHSTPLREDVIHQLVTYPPDEETPSVPSSPSSTFSVGEGAGVMLKSAAGTIGDDFNGGLNVLLVDDNGVNRNLLAHWLRKKNYPYREATDGLEAVQAFMDHPPGYFDVLLLDLSMPNMDGFEAAVEIRKIEAQRKADSLTREEGLFKRSKIFALTGLATAEDKRRAFTAGVDGYLVKPVSFKTLDIVFQNLTTT